MLVLATTGPSLTSIAFQKFALLGSGNNVSAVNVNYTTVSNANTILIFAVNNFYNAGTWVGTFNGVNYIPNQIGIITSSGALCAMCFFCPLGNLTPGSYPFVWHQDFGTNSFSLYVAEYSGAAQSSPVEGVQTLSGQFASTLSMNITTGAANDWVIFQTIPPTTLSGVSGGYVARESSLGTVVDSNAPVTPPPGPYGTTVTWTGSTWTGMMGFALKHG